MLLAVGRYVTSPVQPAAGSPGTGGESGDGRGQKVRLIRSLVIYKYPNEFITLIKTMIYLKVCPIEHGGNGKAGAGVMTHVYDDFLNNRARIIPKQAHRPNLERRTGIPAVLRCAQKP
ncbi:hypothetical protein B6S08_08515 [Oceanimonas doudoroffii]|uniref:Uncharacterized protein n=1 Tax=Oceanimonas doudoroffii TaxID=84158 RepID=A0A233RJE2_9GAMM|nr:hypothetical protein B6S08_08515 [Oceanimonas doudoroffii]